MQILDESYEDIFNEELQSYQRQLLTKETRKTMKDDWAMRINLYPDI